MVEEEGTRSPPRRHLPREREESPELFLHAVGRLGRWHGGQRGEKRTTTIGKDVRKKIGAKQPLELFDGGDRGAPL
jgi:hypothetical protein